MNKVTGGDAPAQIWRRLMVSGLGSAGPRLRLHRGRAAAVADAASDQPPDQPPPQPAAPAAAPPETNAPGSFYRGLAGDFGGVGATLGPDGEPR